MAQVKIKGVIYYKVKKNHPDLKYIPEDKRDKTHEFCDIYNIDTDCFYGREDIENYIKHDLKLVAGGGYDTDTTRSWVCGLIERGFLEEELVDYSGGLPRYKYSLTEKEPNYDNSKFNSSAIKRRTETTVSTVAKDTDTTVDNTQVIKVDLTKGEVSIKIDFNNYKQVEEVIKLILKGE